jgi:uncharacterized protein YyaL (SSP411 family)
MTMKRATLYRMVFYTLCFAAVCLVWASTRTHGSEGPLSTQARKPIPSPEALAELPPDGGPEFNRLVFSQSPYLLQHSANPVDWFPWGDEAFEKARKENKPIFLSIGYSTCHWCHVMEHESFEDDEVAALMNAHFICVKVDREERPDVDKIYMDVTQAMTGHGGWPMTVVLTPDRKPFFAGTYFPKQSRFQRPGMMELIPQLAEAWAEKRDQILESAEQITTHLAEMNAGTAGPALTEETLHLAHSQLVSRFDAKQGGFSQAPKFPTPQNLTFLARYWKRTGDEKVLDMIEKTLIEMRLGGVYDHVGFGFHRYSTDENWLLPHFEKMLYDQALIAMALLDAHQARPHPLYEQTVREIFTYVLRDLTSPEGGFYSAEDADSEGVEGKFYVWTTEEVNQILGEEDGELYRKIFTLRPGGNFAHEAGGHAGKDNIPHLKKTIPDLAADMDIPVEGLQERLEAMRVKLFDVREKRIHPFKDDKILTDWNGLMIAALARGAEVLNDPQYEAAARKAADFLLARLQDDRGRLYKRYRQGQAGLPAHIEDYAFVTWGLLDLYETCGEVRYLQEAVRFNDILLKHFWDAENGGIFITADDGEKLLVRGKEAYDGAIPSGNSVAALNLLRLARMTGNTDYEEKAAQIFTAFSGTVGRSPSAFNQMMCALDFAVGPSYEVVIVESKEPKDADVMIDALRGLFLPNAVILRRAPGDGGRALAGVAPFTEAMTARDDKATAYVCRNFVCNQPTTEVGEMLKFLGVAVED